MTPIEMKLSKCLLNLASNEFSSHCCNDLDLVNDIGITPDEALELKKAMYVWQQDPEITEPSLDNLYTIDWLAMMYISHKIDVDCAERIRLLEILPGTHKSLFDRVQEIIHISIDRLRILKTLEAERDEAMKREAKLREKIMKLMPDFCPVCEGGRMTSDGCSQCNWLMGENDELL